jgi:hypothetical protein
MSIENRSKERANVLKEIDWESEIFYVIRPDMTGTIPGSKVYFEMYYPSIISWI